MTTELVRVEDSQKGGSPYPYYARTLGKRAAYHGARTPLYLGRLVFRGAYGWYLAFGPLYRWVTDYTHAEIRDLAYKEHNAAVAERAEKQRDARVRWRMGTLVVLVFVVPFLLAGFTQLYLGYAYMLVWAAVIFVQAIYGIRLTGRVRDVADEPTAREIADLQLSDINEALVSANVLKAPDEKHPARQMATLASWPERVDGGQEVTINLPRGQGASFEKVRKAHAVLANEFGLHARQLELTPGKAENQVKLWRGDINPFDRVLPDHPLLDVPEWDSFSDGAILGEDIRGRQITLELFETNFLFGGIPGSGKTTGARAVLASAILDRYTEIAVFDGKGGADWSSLEPLAVAHYDGDTDQQAKALAAYLGAQLTDVKERTAALRDARARKLTKEMHENGTPLRVIVVDELQEFLAVPQIGPSIAESLMRIARIARAVGIILVLITQRPDSTLAELFTSLKAQIGTRISYRTLDWRTSDMILGEGMSKQGFATDGFTEDQAGACYVHPGSTVSPVHRGMPAIFGRTYDIGDDEWDALVRVAVGLRGSKARPVTPAVQVPPEMPEPDNTDATQTGDIELVESVVDLLDAADGNKMLVKDMAAQLGYEGHAGTIALGKRLGEVGIPRIATNKGQVVGLEVAERALRKLHKNAR